LPAGQSTQSLETPPPACDTAIPPGAPACASDEHAEKQK
jgi:hypothetical protein